MGAVAGAVIVDQPSIRASVEELGVVRGGAEQVVGDRAGHLRLEPPSSAPEEAELALVDDPVRDEPARGSA